MRFGIAIEADMAHLGRGHKVGHTVYHAQPGAQNGYDAQLFARKHARFAFCHRRFNFDFLQRQLARDLIGHQHANFFQKFAKVLGSAIFVAH